MGGSPMDKAGAYGIQDDFGLKYITQIEGDYYNVVGLPVARLYQELKKQGLLERITWNAAN
jgi:septum formation protein